MRAHYVIGFVVLLLLPSVLAGVGEGETYKVRHTRDYDKFLNAFEPYKLDFIRQLRADHPTIHDARLRKTYTIESVNNDWLLEILFDKQSRDWNKIQLPVDVLAKLGIESSTTDEGISIHSGASLYPSFTKSKAGGTFLPGHSQHEEVRASEVTPEMIQWVRLFKYSILNPVTHRNVRTIELSDEQIRDYLRDKNTRKILGINDQKVSQDLNSLKAFYARYRRTAPMS